MITEKENLNINYWDSDQFIRQNRLLGFGIVLIIFITLFSFMNSATGITNITTPVKPMPRPINAICVHPAECASNHCLIEPGKTSGKCARLTCLSDGLQWSPGTPCCSNTAYTSNINLVMCGKK